MELTGNPDEDGLERCAQLIYSDGGRVLSHLYVCIRNPQYHIKTQFPFVDAYKFLTKNNTVLDAVGDKEDSDGIISEEDEKEGNKEKRVRRLGVEAAKKQKVIKNHERTSVEKCASHMSCSVFRIEKVLLSAQEMKKHISERGLELYERKLEWELSKELFDPGSDARESDRHQMRQLMRKRILSQLRSKEYGRIPNRGVQVRSARISDPTTERIIDMENESGGKDASHVHQEDTCNQSHEVEEGREVFRYWSDTSP